MPQLLETRVKELEETILRAAEIIKRLSKANLRLTEMLLDSNRRINKLEQDVSILQSWNTPLK